MLLNHRALSETQSSCSFKREHLLVQINRKRFGHLWYHTATIFFTSWKHCYSREDIWLNTTFQDMVSNATDFDFKNTKVKMFISEVKCKRTTKYTHSYIVTCIISRVCSCYYCQNNKVIRGAQMGQQLFLYLKYLIANACPCIAVLILNH